MATPSSHAGEGLIMRDYHNPYATQTWEDSTVGPQLSEYPLSELTLGYLKVIVNIGIPKTVQLSAKPNNKWNASVILRLVGFIILQYSG